MNLDKLEWMFIEILNEAKSADEMEMIKQQLYYDVEAEIDVAFEWAMEQKGWYEITE